VILALAAAIYASNPSLVRELRVSGFDAMQRLWPQRVLDDPRVYIVDIDEETLRRYGQWPWPRTRVAQLIERIADAKPGLLGIDIVFPEPDRLSPPQIPKLIPDLPESVIAALSDLPSSEEKLARAIARVPTVLATAPSTEDPTARPAVSRKVAAIVSQGDAPNRFLSNNTLMIRSLPEIVRAARSEASIEAGVDQDGIVRSVPLLSQVEGQLAPAMAVEMIRLAAREDKIVVTTGRTGITNVAIGDISIPTGARGEAYLHFEAPLARYVFRRPSCSTPASIPVSTLACSSATSCFSG
jgi:adenylate cyclase